MTQITAQEKYHLSDNIIMIDLVGIGQRLKNARLHSGFTLKEAAHGSGLSRSTISRIEKTGTDSLKHISFLCETYKASIEWVLFNYEQTDPLTVAIKHLPNDCKLIIRRISQIIDDSESIQP